MPILKAYKIKLRRFALGISTILIHLYEINRYLSYLGILECQMNFYGFFLIVDFGMALLAIYFFGRKALFVIIAVDIIVCNIQVLKTIEIFGMVATLGNILYGSIFLLPISWEKPSVKRKLSGVCGLVFLLSYL